MNELVTAKCGACGAPMVERVARESGRHFMGCSRYPDCDETTKIPAYLEMKRAGGVELPWWETP